MIGVIADDVTGGTDVAAALRRQGLRTQLCFGMPAGLPARYPADATVISLKTRTSPVLEAVEESRAAARWLIRSGAGQLYFKYCSTFDSTDRGNIGPVLDALGEDVADGRPVVTTPSSPEHGRTQYQGYLFVDGVLLAESPMRHHPLTPMRDSYLPRLLDAQSAHAGCAVLDHTVVAGGPDRIAAALRQHAGHTRYLLADALTDADLYAIARACVELPLLAGAAGLAGALAKVHAERIPSLRDAPASPAPRPDGPAVALAGSCSRRTLEQIDVMRSAGRPVHPLDPLADQDPDRLAGQALAWYDGLGSDVSAAGALIHASMPPPALRAVQDALGADRAASILESTLGRIATGLAARGVTRIVVAGGETSGAVVTALGIEGGQVGAEAARGVPWIHTAAGLNVLLKSGNFGERDLLLTATAAEATTGRTHA
ncbi:3-oxo-tetronate kinase [Streptomyces xanthochromogenes]|uniref:3-oxo-tetronate kinase n=1 Tax=Streptomyces xanthochromogenes TaxID=67384 RepID=UPI0034178D86